MKLFVMGIPHTKTTTDFTTCAYTMKVWNLCRMMARRGHHVVHLGTEGSNPECAERVDVVPEAMWAELYGRRPGTEFYDINEGGRFAPLHALYAANAKKAIRERSDGPWKAIVCVTWGGCQRTATEGLDQLVVESGIGYPHTFAKYRIFESYAWMHFIYGTEGKSQGGGWYDAVIPNAFDPDMFDFRAEKDDYFLYLGRLLHSKGVGIAVELTKKIGARLLIVGQGDPGPFLAGNPHVSYREPVGVEGRRGLLSRARALICPTHYVEPFGGVAVEAQLSGTPVISTDWGVFPETVLHGVTGFRCRTMEHFVWAARNIGAIRPEACRGWALENFSLDRVSLMYDEHFRSIANLNGRGWYEPNDGRAELDWLRKAHPGEARP